MIAVEDDTPVIVTHLEWIVPPTPMRCDEAEMFLTMDEFDAAFMRVILQTKGRTTYPFDSASEFRIEFER